MWYIIAGSLIVVLVPVLVCLLVHKKEDKSDWAKTAVVYHAGAQFGKSARKTTGCFPGHLRVGVRWRNHIAAIKAGDRMAHATRLARIRAEAGVK